MKIVFTGRDNPFNRKLVQDFAAEHEILCCLFLEPERTSPKAMRKKIMRRIKKFGLIKVVDQLAFHFFDRRFLRKNELAFWKTRPGYCDNSIGVSCPVYNVDSINDAQWVELCRKLQPDIILATCSHVILKPALYNIPPLGTFIIHEGLTPEYKGLHTATWTLMKKEFQYIGYTVFKVNGEIDGGEILIQDTYPLQPGEGYRTWSWIGHNAIISGVENIKRAFGELEKNKHFTPLNTSARKSGYYTWMGLSDFLRLYFKNYWRATGSRQSVKPRQMEGAPVKGEPKDAVLH